MARPMKNSLPKVGSSSKAKGEQAPEQYTDFDEAIDAGVEAEEKAERFAVGIKARRHFERSLSLYRRSLQLKPTSADAAYNCARVLFLLGTSFYQPWDSTASLRESVRLYKQALSLSPSTEMANDGSSLPNAFYLDVLFNLGAAYMALSDQIDEGSSSDFKVDRDADGERSVLIQEAITSFENVVQGQEAVLARQRIDEQEAIRQASEMTEEAPEEEQQAQSIDEPMMAGDASSNDDSEGEDQYTTSLITPASAMETLHNIHMASLALIDAASVDAAQTVEKGTMNSLYAQTRAQQLAAAYPDGEKRSPDGEWVEGLAQIQYAPLATKVAEASKHAEIAGGQAWPTESSAEDKTLSSLEEEVISSVDAMLSEAQTPVDVSSTTGRLQQRIRTGHLEELGDYCLSLARVRIRCVDARASPLQNLSDSTGEEAQKTMATRSWNLLARASKAFLAALASLDTQSGAQATSAVLGSSNTSTTTSRARLTLYTSLSTTSMLRTHRVFMHSAFITPTSLGTLLENARVYARKGLTEVGLGWMLSYKGTTSKAERQLATSHPFPYGGIESLRSETEAILTLLRALFARQQQQDVAVFKTANSAEAGAMEVECLCAALRHLVQRSDATPETAGTPWRVALSASSEGVSVKGTPLVEQILGEEGDIGLTETERQFWRDVYQGIFS